MPFNNLAIPVALACQNIPNDKKEKLFDETTRNCIWLTDDKEAGYCIFVKETKGLNKDKLLEIQNPNSKSLLLWRIDGVMCTEADEQPKCDCALSHDKAIHFIEFKSNARNRTLESIQNNYEKAREQLSSTIRLFEALYQQHGDGLFSIFEDIDAIIVFNRLVPRNSTYQKSLAKSFLQQHGIRLRFENSLRV